MLSADGAISEGSGENIFVISDGVVYTPPIAAGCLDGITRNTAHHPAGRRRIRNRGKDHPSLRSLLLRRAVHDRYRGRGDADPPGRQSGYRYRQARSGTRRAQQLYGDAFSGKLAPTRIGSTMSDPLA